LAGGASRRQAKFETILNDRNPKFKTVLFWKFGYLKLGFVSDLDIRISDLSNNKTSLVSAMPG